MKYSPYSFSRINTYQTCPRKFKYKYIDKLKGTPGNLDALLKGGAVHHILESYPEPSSHSLAPKYQDIADKFIGTTLGKSLIFRESTREYRLGLTQDLEICEYNDKNAMFRGAVDYMFLDDNTLFIVDWKTGKYREQKWQSYDQLMFYALYFFIKYPSLNNIKVSYVYVEHNEMHNDLSMERKYLDNYKIKLLTAITNIESDQNFPKCISKLCPWCEYLKICESDI